MAVGEGSNPKKEKAKDQYPDKGYYDNEKGRYLKKWEMVVKFFKNNALSLVMIFVIVLATASSAKISHEITKNIHKPEVREVKVPVEKIIKVEPETVPTSDLIRFLNPKVDSQLAGLIGIEIDSAAKKHNLPRNLIIAIMRRESNFNPLAASKVAVGLMQIYPKWHPEKVESYTNDQLYHININIDIGCQIWAEYFEQEKGDLDKTFHAYLSKNASSKLKNGYMTDILTFIAKLTIYEFQQVNKPTGIIALNGPEDKPRDLFKER